MNDRNQSKNLDGTCFDRLVDGELSAMEYRALLKQLDARPVLWRDCALAFLEAQAWRSEITAIRRGQEMTPAAKPGMPATVLPWQRWLHLLAIAASFVLTFAGGLVVQRHFDRRADAIRMAASQEGDPSQVAPMHKQAPRRDNFPAIEKEPDAVGNIRLVVDGGRGNQPQHIDIPVYDLDEVGAGWLTQDRPVLPDDVIESLQRRGRKVERQVEYLPLPLDEQRQIVVPVEQIQITPVSRQSY